MVLRYFKAVAWLHFLTLRKNIQEVVTVTLRGTSLANATLTRWSGQHHQGGPWMSGIPETLRWGGRLTSAVLFPNP